MKEIDVSHGPLADLVAEVERTGEGIVLTRDGRRAARLEPERNGSDAAESAEALRRIIAARDAQAAAHAGSAQPTTWAQLKSWMDEDR